MTDFDLEAAKRIPANTRKTLLEEKFIERAVNIGEINTPMEYVFDVFEEFVDIAGEHDDWNCHHCRQAVLQRMQQLLPKLKELEAQKYGL